MIFWIAHRLVPCHQRGFLLWQQMGMGVETHIMHRESKLGVSISSLPSEIREPGRNQEEKIVGVRGDGRHQETLHLEPTKWGSYGLTGA